MLNFCLQSLFREYGWRFFRRVAAPHPVRTARALLRCGARDLRGDAAAAHGGDADRSLGGRRCIVGVGFCLKPILPACPSGRFNHDCLCLERLRDPGARRMPDACGQCAIREIGTLALNTGATFYIMTSARDILSDVFTPALEEGRYTSGLFVLCRYSHPPFEVGLRASGIRGMLFALAQGDCADYRTWLRADRGVKDELTAISDLSRREIARILGNAAREPYATQRYRRIGSVYCPE